MRVVPPGSPELRDSISAPSLYPFKSAEEVDALYFRMLYWGEALASSNSKRRAAEKQAMRRQFHPQLRRLWNTRRNLRFLAGSIGMGGEVISDGGVATVPRTGSWEGLGFEKMADERPFNGFRFIPLVTENKDVRCNIEILFLRHEDTENLIIQGGDIDGRIKTIFDALRIPKAGELSLTDKPTPGEDPFFVLLEDDKLISQITVSAEQLLLLPGTSAMNPNDAFLQIKIELSPTSSLGEGYFSPRNR